MATITYLNEKDYKKQEVNQGDFVYCKAVNGGASSFWGIYNAFLQKVIALDGAGDEYIKINDKLYVGNIHNHWIIDKVIPCNKAIITISEEK